MKIFKREDIKEISNKEETKGRNFVQQMDNIAEVEKVTISQETFHPMYVIYEECSRKHWWNRLLFTFHHITLAEISMLMFLLSAISIKFVMFLFDTANSIAKTLGVNGLLCQIIIFILLVIVVGLISAFLDKKTTRTYTYSDYVFYKNIMEKDKNPIESVEPKAAEEETLEEPTEVQIPLIVVVTSKKKNKKKKNKK